MSYQYLQDLGISEPGHVYENLPPAQLAEESVKRGQGVLASNGAISADTGVHTGRSPKDKYVVRRPDSQDRIWWGPVNPALDADKAETLQAMVADHLNGQDLFVVDASAGADPSYAIPVRVVTPFAWHALFGQSLFRRELVEGKDDERWTVMYAPKFHAPAEELGLRTSTAIVLDTQKRLITICGTEYAGEMKKSIFTVMNYLMPQRGALSMHCSANVGPEGDVALFFGLSGTGKTSLSADPNRGLIGDDEHVWTDDSTFNVEGGCYAKAIKLREEKEPEIYHAIRFGSVMENVTLDPKTRVPDYNDGRKTENTRVAYPLDFIPNAVASGMAAAPSAVVFLTADAFGVMPPISILTPEQAMFHFLNGYTAKLAGTEKGVTEPEATFSSCFGQPFLPLPPKVYGDMLERKLRESGVPVYLVNTGWSGGPFGVGSRIDITHTRAMVTAALNGSLADVPTVTDPIFGLTVPTEVPGVPSEILDPRNTWSNPEEYDIRARTLAQRFQDNFRKFQSAETAQVAVAAR